LPGFEFFGSEERQAVVDLFDANNGILFAHGYANQRKGIFRVRELEQMIAEMFGVGHVQAVSSGSAALWCAMRALGIGPGDEVITQAFTFVASVEAILMTGAKPVVVDIDRSLNMSPAAVEKAITARTKLIMPVHMAGVAAKMDEIFAIAQARNIPVLEDSAQAIGGSYRGKPLGTLADAGVFSLDFNKIVTCGEGGLVLTNDERVYSATRALHDHGHEYDSSVPRGLDPHHTWGFNFRMTELQAAIAMAQFRKLDSFVATQKEHQGRLKQAMIEARLPVEFRELADPDGDNGDTLFFFTESASKASEVVAALNRVNVGTKNVPDALGWHFAANWDHLLGPFYDRPLPEVFEQSAELLSRTVSVPIWLKPDETWFDRAALAVISCFK